MRLLSASEDRFMVNAVDIPEKIDENYLNITLGHRPIPKTGKDEMDVAISIKYSYDNAVLLDCQYTFHFHVENLKDFIVEDTKDSVTIRSLMPHLVNIAVGTMRGLIMAKTAGTKLSRYPLPIVNAMSITNAKQ